MGLIGFCSWQHCHVMRTIIRFAFLLRLAFDLKSSCRHKRIKKRRTLSKLGIANTVWIVKIIRSAMESVTCVNSARFNTYQSTDKHLDGPDINSKLGNLHQRPRRIHQRRAMSNRHTDRHSQLPHSINYQWRVANARMRPLNNSTNGALPRRPDRDGTQGLALSVPKITETSWSAPTSEVLELVGKTVKDIWELEKCIQRLNLYLR